MLLDACGWRATPDNRRAGETMGKQISPTISDVQSFKLRRICINAMRLYRMEATTSGTDCTLFTLSNETTLIRGLYRKLNM